MRSCTNGEEPAVEGIKWICEVCDKPILGNTGYIEIVNLDEKEGRIGGYPRIPTPGTLNTGGKGYWMADEFLDADFEPDCKIGFKVVHLECDPLREVEGYWLSTEFLDSPEEWLRTLHHLAGKGWLGIWDLHVMMELWPMYGRRCEQRTAGKDARYWETRWSPIPRDRADEQ